MIFRVKLEQYIETLALEQTTTFAIIIQISPSLGHTSVLILFGYFIVIFKSTLLESFARISCKFLLRFRPIAAILCKGLCFFASLFIKFSLAFFAFKIMKCFLNKDA